MGVGGWFCGLLEDLEWHDSHQERFLDEAALRIFGYDRSPHVQRELQLAQGREGGGEYRVRFELI